MAHSRFGLVGPAALVLILVLALSGTGFARGPGEGHVGSDLERALERLELDPETRSAAYALLDAARPTSRELRRQLRAAGEDLRSLLDSASPDPQAVLAQVEAAGGLQTELRKHELLTLLQVRALLSPEQAELLREQGRRHQRRPD